jgi:hypothetical protein
MVSRYTLIEKGYVMASINHYSHKYYLLVVLLLSIFKFSSKAEAAECWVYSINLQGTATLGDANFTSGSQPFSVNQFLFVRLGGVRANPIELAFETLQDLNAAPQVGQLLLLSNSIYARNAGIASAQYDLASVGFSENNTILNFTVNTEMSLQQPPPNVFVSLGIGSTPGGLGGLGFLSGAGGQLGELINNASILQVSLFVPRTGSGYLFSPDGNWSTIKGEINITGSGLDNASNQGKYLANVTGSLIGSVECP